MMRSLVPATMFLAMLGGRSLQAHQELTLQLSGTTQVQFAGYYIANYQGFYDEAGLAVTVNAGGPEISPDQVLADGRADIIVERMPAALASREKGIPLVNIAQPFKHSGMELACRKDSGIASPLDLEDKIVGVRRRGDEYPFLSWMAKLGLSSASSPSRITLLEQDSNADPLFEGQVDCISTTSYDQYWQSLDIDEASARLMVFNYRDQGVTMLDDGLYVLASTLGDPGRVNALAAFVRQSMRGWEWARTNPDEATRILLEYDTAGTATGIQQRRMLTEINKLTRDSDGRLDPADYEHTVRALLAIPAHPPITTPPSAAWTHMVTDAVPQPIPD